MFDDFDTQICPEEMAEMMYYYEVIIKEELENEE